MRTRRKGRWLLKQPRLGARMCQGTFLFTLLVNFLYIPSEESKFCYNKKGIKRRDKKKGISMEQYKVILVDDEVEVIDIMKQKIRWNDLGFDVVGSATNGVKALELVEKLQPDVVLTDIKMPYMDGLELARKLNQDYPNIYIMLCTGFDEFEYAKEAVHLEIKEYMLKPISATELSESLMKLKATLDREREEKLNVKKLEDYFQEVLPKLQSNLFPSRSYR